MKKARLMKTLAACALSACCAGAFFACGEATSAEEIPAVKGQIVVQGYEWGPAIPKVIVEFQEEVSGIDKDTFAVSMTAGYSAAKRTVTDAYNCDEKGSKVTGASKYAAIEMSVKSSVASPFSYNSTTNRNSWIEKIPVTITVNKDQSFKSGKIKYVAGAKYKFDATKDNRLVPQTASWNKDSVNYNENNKNITLSRASWAPEGAATDSGQNPLVIWLHGAGEGGTDIDIDLLGNEVTALTAENATNVQGYFKKDGLAGAYVLAVQSPTMWMDKNGDGAYNDQTGTLGVRQTSYYTEALWKAITTYVEGNSDVDVNRIYLGGCSNGGYMTMNMAFEHGDYFAAYYPICQAYGNANIDETMLAQIKDYKMWFLLSEDDITVLPGNFTIPLFRRLIDAGAQNMHLTYTKNVKGVDDPNPASFGTPGGCYMGHWSWIYAFNDEVKTEMDMSKVSGAADLKPENCTKAGNLWQWLAEQRK